MFANDEAISSYRYALSLVDESPSANVPPEAGPGLRAKLAKVYLLIGRHADAHAALHEALGLVGADDRLQAARLQVLLGQLETADHCYGPAIAAFDTAEELIGAHPEDRDQESVDLWLEVQLDGRANLHYWGNEPEKALAVLAAVRPVVEGRGTAARRQIFYWSLAAQRMRETRYRVDEETLDNLRASAAAGRETGDEQRASFPIFCLGFGLLWYGDLAGAQRHLAEAFATADRVGDKVLRARCLCYLNVRALRGHDREAVRLLAPEALAAAEAAHYPEYVAAAKATLAWVAWRDERSEDVLALAAEALELWRTNVVSYSWYWLCLWPLIAVHLEGGRTAEAVAASRQLLVPPQQRLPDELERLVQSVGEFWDEGEEERAAAELSRALSLAAELRYA